MDSPKDSAAARIFGEKLADKIPAPIPETSVIPPGQLSVDTGAAVRNSSSPSPGLARTRSQRTEELAYSQRFALRTVPGKSDLFCFWAIFTDYVLL